MFRDKKGMGYALSLSLLLPLGGNSLLVRMLTSRPAAHILCPTIMSCRQKALSNILKAYSIFNIEIGYCQGMADIAALLVMYMEEEVRPSRTPSLLCTQNLTDSRA
jgi:hypothetical protein